MDITHGLVGAPIIFALATIWAGSRWGTIVANTLNLITIAMTGIAFFLIYRGILPASVDAVSLVFVGLTTMTVTAVLAVATQNTPNYSRFAALVFLTQLGLNLAFLQNSALWFYIGWEIALIPSLLLIFGWGGLGRKAAGIKFLIYTVAGSLGMLASILYLYSHTGTTDWALLSITLLPSSVQLIAFLGFFVAFAVKIPVFPFHNWQADTYSESNLPTAMLLSAVFSKLGLYGLYRLVTSIAPDATTTVAPFIITLCVIGSIYAAILAFSQSNLKRVVAFSSMSHLNLAAAGFFADRLLGLPGALLQSIAHGGVAIGLWWGIGILKNRFGHTRLHELPGGITSENRWFTIAFFMITLAAMGVPLTSGFPGELLLIQSITHHGIGIGILAAVPMILGAVYMLRAYQSVMLGDPKPSKVTIQLNRLDYVMGTAIVSFILLIGIYPQLIFRLFTLR